MACRSRDKAVMAIEKIHDEQAQTAAKSFRADASSATDKISFKAVFVHPRSDFF
jgi:hypothetical protein